ncbi:MAG: HEAT repeat domain-containing protein [Deltaproteobacteria bacterium]|nr:HEAT repeat domain-containing protein [Deltaproteobacteria bacterium]
MLTREELFPQSESTPEQQVSKLIEALNSQDRQTRYNALIKLAQLGGDAIEARLDLANILTQDPDPYLRAKAAEALGSIGEDLNIGQDVFPKLLHALRYDKDIGVQYSTMQALSHMYIYADLSGPYIENFLKSPHPYMRREAALTLGHIQYDESHPKLSKLLLNDPNEDVRAAAAEAIHEFRVVFMDAEKKTPLPALTKALKDPHPRVRASAAKAMSNFWNYESPIAALGEALQDSDPAVRLAAITSLSHSSKDSTAIIPQFITALDDEQPGVRYHAAILLSKYPDKKELTIPHLMNAMKGEDPEIRDKATDAFISLGKDDPTLVPSFFQSVLTQQDSNTQLSIVNALIGFSKGDASVTMRLLDLLENEAIFYDSKLKILQSMGKSSQINNQVLEKLAAQLKSKDRMMRQSAAVALEEIRPNLSPEYRVTLEQILKQTLYKDNLPDLCQTLCRMANSPSIWASDAYLHPDHAFREQDPWGYALQTLGALFVTKAASFCPQAQSTVDGIIYSLSAESPNAQGLPAECDPMTFPFADIQKFANSMLKTPGMAQSAPQVYGNQFLLLLISEILRNHHKKLTDAQRMKFMDLYEEARRHLKAQLSHAPQTYTNQHEGSLFNIYAIATSILPDSISLGPIGQGYLIKAIDPKNPLHIGYDPSRTPESERASAARAVPTYLALYRSTERADREQKETYRTHLMSSLNNYVYYLPSLMSHLRRGSVISPMSAAGYSPHSGEDSIAPYYLYSSIPYATAAVQSLLQEKRSPEEKEKLLELKRDLRTAILSLVNENGLFYTPEYSSSPGYVDPLFGLALIPYADECTQGEVPSFNLKGILNW